MSKRDHYPVQRETEIRALAPYLRIDKLQNWYDQLPSPQLTVTDDESYVVTMRRRRSNTRMASLEFDRQEAPYDQTFVRGRQRGVEDGLNERGQRINPRREDWDGMAGADLSWVRRSATELDLMSNRTFNYTPASLITVRTPEMLSVEEAEARALHIGSLVMPSQLELAIEQHVSRDDMVFDISDESLYPAFRSATE